MASDGPLDTGEEPLAAGEEPAAALPKVGPGARTTVRAPG